MSHHPSSTQKNRQTQRSITTPQPQPVIGAVGHQTDPATLRQTLNNPHRARPEAILALQRTIGNQAIQRLLASSTANVIQRKSSSDEGSEEIDWSGFESTLTRYQEQISSLVGEDTIPLEDSARRQLNEAGRRKPRELRRRIAEVFRDEHEEVDIEFEKSKPIIEEVRYEVFKQQLLKARKGVKKNSKGGFLGLHSHWHTEKATHHTDKMKNVSKIARDLQERNEISIQSYHEALRQLEEYADYYFATETRQKDPNERLQPLYEEDRELCEQIEYSVGHMWHCVGELSELFANRESYDDIDEFRQQWEERTRQYRDWREQVNALYEQRERLNRKVAKEVAAVAQMAEHASNIAEEIGENLMHLRKKFYKHINNLNEHGQLRQLFKREIKKGSHKSPSATAGMEAVKFLGMAVTIGTMGVATAGVAPLLVTLGAAVPNIAVNSASMAISDKSSGTKRTRKGMLGAFGTKVIAPSVLGVVAAPLEGPAKFATLEIGKAVTGVADQGIETWDARRKAKKSGQPRPKYTQEMKKLGPKAIKQLPGTVLGATTTFGGAMGSATEEEKIFSKVGYLETTKKGTDQLPSVKGKKKEQHNNRLTKKMVKKDKKYKEWDKKIKILNRPTRDRRFLVPNPYAGIFDPPPKGMPSMTEQNDEWLDDMYEEDEPGHIHPHGIVRNDCPGCH